MTLHNTKSASSCWFVHSRRHNETRSALTRESGHLQSIFTYHSRVAISHVLLLRRRLLHR